jgi:CubicO group peptidase (beta-lactamase class C family)
MLHLALAALLVLPTQDSKVEEARAVAQAILADGAPGLSCAVAVKGEVVWSEGFGFADVERAIAVTRTTRFRVGSVAKSLTAAGLALLVEAGALDLDVPIQELVPTFPEQPEGTITPRLLAGNLSGIRHYKGLEFRANEPWPDLASSLAIFQDDPLECAPGERFSYSTYGWTLLAVAMERASGKEFLAYMDAHVFRPLAMNATGPDYADRTLPGRATCYERVGQRLVVAAPVDNSYKWPGGGFLSNAEDLTRFGSALLAPGFLRAESLELLCTSQKTTAGEPTGYGVGLFVQLGARAGRVVRHGGGSVGGTTMFFVDRDSGVVVALVTNLSSGPVNLARARELARIFAPE